MRIKIKSNRAIRVIHTLHPDIVEVETPEENIFHYDNKTPPNEIITCCFTTTEIKKTWYRNAIQFGPFDNINGQLNAYPLWKLVKWRFEIGFGGTKIICAFDFTNQEVVRTPIQEEFIGPPKLQNNKLYVLRSMEERIWEDAVNVDYKERERKLEQPPAYSKQ